MSFGTLLLTLQYYAPQAFSEITHFDAITAYLAEERKAQIARPQLLLIEQMDRLIPLVPREFLAEHWPELREVELVAVCAGGDSPDTGDVRQRVAQLWNGTAEYLGIDYVDWHGFWSACAHTDTWGKSRSLLNDHHLLARAEDFERFRTAYVESGDPDYTPDVEWRAVRLFSGPRWGVGA